MARPIRVEYAHAVYHVTARGNERRAIFRDDRDRERFLDTLGEAVERFGVAIHAYCLMPNHYHLLLQTPRANLSAAAGWLQTTYTIRFNRRHRRSGHLFQGRFKAHLVEADAYARQLIGYIHLNPVRPKDKRKPIPPQREPELARYRWSSHSAYAGVSRSSAPPWLCLEWLTCFGATGSGAQAEYRREIAQMFGRVIPSPWEDIRHGLVLGGEALWDKACRVLAKSEGDEEIRWRRRAERDQVSQVIEQLVELEQDRRVRIWLRVRLGGQRMSEIAKEYGYSDGSGVHQVVKRLEAKAGKDRELLGYLEALAEKVSCVKS